MKSVSGYAALIRCYLLVGLIGFGGGSAMIPVIHQQIVERHRLISDEEYTRHTIVANITPGAQPAKLAAASGLAIAGWRAAILAMCAVSFPGLILTISIICVRDLLGSSVEQVIAHASVGISIVVIAMLNGYIIRIHRRGSSPLYPLITAASALATCGRPLGQMFSLIGVGQVNIPSFDPIVVIGICLIAIVIFSLIRDHTLPFRRPLLRDAMSAPLKAMMAFIVVTIIGIAVLEICNPGRGFHVGILLLASSLSSFGGGAAYIGVADAFFVSTDIVQPHSFYAQIVPIANATPGPVLLKIAAGIGYMQAGDHRVIIAVISAIAAFLIAAASCCALMMPMVAAYELFHGHPIIIAISRFLLPAICGLLISVSLTMLTVSSTLCYEAGCNPYIALTICLIAIVITTWIRLRGIPDIVSLIVLAAISTIYLA